jgi:hypothetical protein
MWRLIKFIFGKQVLFQFSLNLVIIIVKDGNNGSMRDGAEA